jgi:hypothetical protein
LNFDGDIDLFGFPDWFKNGLSLSDGFFDCGPLLFVPLSCFLLLLLSILDSRASISSLSVSESNESSLGVLVLVLVIVVRYRIIVQIRIQASFWALLLLLVLAVLFSGFRFFGIGVNSSFAAALLLFFGRLSRFVVVWIRIRIKDSFGILLLGLLLLSEASVRRHLRFASFWCSSLCVGSQKPHNQRDRAWNHVSAGKPSSRCHPDLPDLVYPGRRQKQTNNRISLVRHNLPSQSTLHFLPLSLSPSAKRNLWRQ